MYLEINIPIIILYIRYIRTRNIMLISNYAIPTLLIHGLHSFYNLILEKVTKKG